MKNVFSAGHPDQRGLAVGGKRVERGLGVAEHAVVVAVGGRRDDRGRCYAVGVDAEARQHEPPLLPVL